MPKFKKFLRITLAVLSVFIIVCAAFFAASLYVWKKYSKEDLKAQEERVAALRLEPGTPVDEQSFADFDIYGQNVKLNEVRTINVHNSYRKFLSPFISAFFNVLVPKEKRTELIYEHAPLTDQLNGGVRSLEWDIRSSDGVLGIYHASVFDYGSHIPSLALALEELKIWSDNNPGHIPISILIEYKSESPLLNIKRDKPGIETLKAVDNLIISSLGLEKLITPADIIGSYADMKSAVENGNWPALSASKGKVMFLLHYDDKLTEAYVESDRDLKSQAMFPTVMVYDGNYSSFEKYAPYVSHVLLNTPVKSEIDALVAKGYIVRTRVDAGMAINPNHREEAMSSRAQILTTDYIKGRRLPEGDYNVCFDGGRTVSLIRSAV